MTVGVVIPTVLGRSRECEHAIESHNVPGVQYVVIFGKPTCGQAWMEGAKALRSMVGDLTHIMFTADDLVAHSGWLAAALETCAAGALPAPVLYNEDLTEWQRDGAHGEKVAFSRVPFMPIEVFNALPPIPPIHYYSDCWYGDRAHELGLDVRVHEEYAFTHTWAQPGRIHDDSKDRSLYEDLKARLP